MRVIIENPADMLLAMEDLEEALEGIALLSDDIKAKVEAFENAIRRNIAFDVFAEL